MAEPTSTAGISITALFIALLGPMAGQYSLIIMAALAGALWPLSTMGCTTRISGAFFLLRIVVTAVFLTGSAAWWLQTHYAVPVFDGMAVIAFLIGALGNGWGPVFKALRDGLGAVARSIGCREQ